MRELAEAVGIVGGAWFLSRVAPDVAPVSVVMGAVALFTGILLGRYLR